MAAEKAESRAESNYLNKMGPSELFSAAAALPQSVLNL